MKLKWLAISYTLFLVAVVFLADWKQGQFLFRLVRETPNADKLGHFFLMGLFSLLVNLALSCKRVSIGRFRPLLGSLFVIAIVTLEEFSQRYVRYRTFDLVDLAFDYTGIFLFGLLAKTLTMRKKLS